MSANYSTASDVAAAHQDGAGRARARVSSASGVTPGLGTLLVGDDPSSARYVAMKIDECAEIGVRSFDVHLPADGHPGATSRRSSTASTPTTTCTRSSCSCRCRAA